MPARYLTNFEAGFYRTKVRFPVRTRVSHNSFESSLELAGIRGVDRVTPQNASDSRAVDSVALNDEDQVLDILGRSVIRLWDVVNDLTRLTPTRRSEFYAFIYGQSGLMGGIGIEGSKITRFTP